MTEHETHYEAIAQQIGIDKLRAILENGLYDGIFRKSKPIKAFPTPEKMAELARADKHLNNWPLAHWDAQHNAVLALLKGTGIKSWPLSDTVCTLKHVAKFHYSETLAESEAKKPTPEPIVYESVQTPKLPTIEQFISKHGIRFECHRVEKRPDGLMDADYPKERHFRCRISKNNPVVKNLKFGPITERGLHSFGLYFSQGSAHTEDPTLADVLDSLASDASGYENAPDFADWASEYGYDTDSRKAEKTFRTIKRHSEQLKRTIGAEAYEELLCNTERL